MFGRPARESIFTKTFSSSVVATLQVILLVGTFRNCLPRLKRIEPGRRRKRDKIRGKLLRLLRLH
jgi:hypothetical protein